jgi:hypothetical protein
MNAVKDNNSVGIYVLAIIGAYTVAKVAAHLIMVGLA